MQDCISDLALLHSDCASCFLCSDSDWSQVGGAHKEKYLLRMCSSAYNTFTCWDGQLFSLANLYGQISQTPSEDDPSKGALHCWRDDEEKSVLRRNSEAMLKNSQ